MILKKILIPFLVFAVPVILVLFTGNVDGNYSTVILRSDSTHDDHGMHHSSDSTEMHHRGNDDGPMHDMNDDRGAHHSSDSTEVHHKSNDDGPMHDINDDHGKHHDEKESEHHQKRKGRDK